MSIRLPLDAACFRRACGKFATGIAIVTVLDSTGAPHGMTVNSFTSVSLDPPLVLLCIDNRAAILPHLLTAEFLGVNVLTASQTGLSARFARPGEDRFGTVEWSPGDLGVPVLPDILAIFECERRTVVEAGDHQILIAQAHAVRWRDEAPLLYFNSEYRALPNPS